MCGRALLIVVLANSRAIASTAVVPDGYELISPNGYVTGLGPLRRMYSTTIEACATACTDDSSCFGFDWDTKDYDCQLESVDYTQAVEGGHWKTDANGDWVFYSKIWSTATSSSSTTSTTTTYFPDDYELISPNGYVTGLGPLRRMYSTTIEACATACTDDSSCFGFDWDTKDYDCQLESVDYTQAVEGGHWKTDANGDWVFYSKIWSTATSSSSTTSTATTYFPDDYELISPNGYVTGLGPLRRMYSTTIEACATACTADASCKGFDWDTKDYDCQLESVDYADAVDGGHWKTDANGDWVFYSRLATSTSTSTSTSTTVTPSPCLAFCDHANNTKIGQDCLAVSKKSDCKSSFLGDGEVVIPCKWAKPISFLPLRVCLPAEAHACPEDVFASCSCVSTSGWSNKRCRNNCHYTSQGQFHSSCQSKCSDGCLANTRRLAADSTSLRGSQVLV